MALKTEMKTQEQSEKLIFDPGEYYQSLLAGIDLAHEEIILETYLFRLDELGQQFLSALIAASSRGVRIRLLVDGVGSYYDANEIAERLESPNCQVRIFHPLPWDFPAYRRGLTSGRWYSQMLHSLAMINRRNHRKLCLIDEHIAWLGSYNISADHFNRTLHNSDDNWHDTGLRVMGPIVPELKRNFEEVWHRKGGSIAYRARNFLSNNSIRARRRRNRRLIGILQEATERIWITNAYFNPSPRLLKTLKAAARKGVNVRVITPSHSDVLFFPSLSRTYYVDLLGAGIQVFELEIRVLHSKTMLIDNQALVGSTNLNYRSFFHDLELDALLNKKESVQCLQEKFCADIEDCSEITLAHWQDYPWLLKMLGWISRIIRYWI
ncbi:MAG: phosphatidylserine/phosphatidylglycerophosphate/cardiolipin synthase family protein [Gammaproteobacteria bacterium]